MSRHATGVPWPGNDCAPSPQLPADHVLSSGAVLFPGAFDQHGCPLIVFPVGAQAKLSLELSKAEVVNFINYFLCLHNKKQEEDSLVSVVADLSRASLPTTRFIAETLLLLELHKPTVHSVYIIQPKKKDVFKLLQKVLAPSKSHSASFKRVFLKEIPELSNYIDRSQLTASLGGYLMYCHQSWVSFIKDIDAFLQEFLSVVQRLPSCISTLQSLSRLPLPTTFRELHYFCSTNEAKFQQLRRELGLDELLRHCESVVEKLRYPEKEPCYQAMAGTAFFIHTAFNMLQNHSRITAAVEKVELLWQQAFSKARLQLQVFQLREDALQITDQIETLFQERLQPHQMKIARDAAKAAVLVSHFEKSTHTPAMALVRCAEDVVHTLTEVMPVDSWSKERWVLDLERLKEKLHSSVHFTFETLRAVCNYHHCFNKANTWYGLVLSENLLQELLSGVDTDGTAIHHERRTRGTIPAWRHKLSSFLKKNRPPDVEELVHLAHLSNVIPDEEVQQAGTQMSQRCLTLRKLLTSSGPVAVGPLQLALQWQYELLRSCHVGQSSDATIDGTAHDGPSESNHIKTGNQEPDFLGASPSTAVSGLVSSEVKPPSLSSFDSGFDGAGSSKLEVRGGREAMESLSRSAGTRDLVRHVTNHPLIHEENISSVSDPEFDCGSVGSASRPTIQIIPKVTEDSLNVEIKVKRCAALPSNPWLSLPLDDLENMYTVTITQNHTPQKTDLQSHHPSNPCTTANHFNRSQDSSSKMEVLRSVHPGGPQSQGWILHSQSSLDDPELSPMSHILCSTITDGRDKSTCTTEGGPSLLWDSYDLHEQSHDLVHSVVDISQKDWDEKEQEGLKEVEEILIRADEILEEEEHVLAQEAELEALLRSEDCHSPWSVWDSEEQLGVMTSSALSEPGVPGPYFNPAEPGSHSEPRSTGSASKTKTSESDGCWTEAGTEADMNVFESRPDLLTELRTVHVLDELIMQENLKIHELRRCEGYPSNKFSESKTTDTTGLSSVIKEREAFRLQLEKEKREVEKLENSLDKECKVKKHKGQDRKIVRCSIMGKARTENKEHKALCAEPLSEGYKRPRPTWSTSVDQTEDGCRTENVELLPGVAEEAIPLNIPQHQDPTPSEAAGSGCDSSTFKDASDLKLPPEGQIEPQAYDCSEEMDGSGDNGATCKPEASLTPETRPDDGAFDPGGEALAVANDSLVDHETPCSTELLNPHLSPAAQDPSFVESENVTPAVSLYSLSVKQQSNNNNNHLQNCKSSLDHLSEMSTKGEEDTKVPHCGLHPTMDIQIASPLHECLNQQLLLDQGEQNEDLLDEVHSSETLRISGSGSPGIQTLLTINSTEMMEFKTPIVLDTGSGLMKAGFADQDHPSIIFPTIVGVPKYEEVMNGHIERDTYIGHEAQLMRGVLALRRPIKNGIIRNWDEMEKIWHHTFQQLCVDPEDHPVLLTEAAMNPLDNRQRMVEIMFECFNVPLTYVAMQAVLALYAAGRSTGVVFDSGDGVSHSVPVFEGYSLPYAVQRFPLAGADITMQLKKLLQEQGVNMHTTAEMEIVREMKEQCCCVALNYEEELTKGGPSCKEVHYTMPDGRIVTLSSERFRAPEILFKPELIGQEHYGMHKSIFKSILSSDIDLRRCLLGNIVLSGGNTLLPSLPERLQAEIKGLVPVDMGDSVCVTSPKDRDFSVWSGGAVLANLPTFSSAWIRQEEYAEFGPQIVFRKCF